MHRGLYSEYEDSIHSHDQASLLANRAEVCILSVRPITLQDIFCTYCTYVHTHRNVGGMHGIESECVLRSGGFGCLNFIQEK